MTFDCTSRRLLFCAGMGLAICVLCARWAMAATNALFADKPLSFSIAACTTWHPVLSRLQEWGAEVVYTTRTRDSFALLAERRVDLIIGGRPPLTGEPVFEFAVIGPGYVFLSSRRRVLPSTGLHAYHFVTDQPLEPLISCFEGIGPDNLTSVENVYDHLSQGIAITVATNTDFKRAQPVFVRQPDGTHHRYSRVPIVYYRHPDQRPLVEHIKEAMHQAATAVSAPSTEP